MTSIEASQDYVNIIEAELAAGLGAEAAVYTEKVTLFIAHQDRNAVAVADVARWISEAEKVLSRLGGGATSLAARGAWLGDRPEPLHEDTTLVYTYAPPSAILQHLAALKSFLHRYGQETDQGEVAMLLENNDGQWFFRIPRPFSPG